VPSELVWGVGRVAPRAAYTSVRPCGVRFGEQRKGLYEATSESE